VPPKSPLMNIDAIVTGRGVSLLLEAGRSARSASTAAASAHTGRGERIHIDILNVII
jgi:hypothetical protein